MICKKMANIACWNRSTNIAYNDGRPQHGARFTILSWSHIVILEERDLLAQSNSYRNDLAITEIKVLWHSGIFINYSLQRRYKCTGPWPQKKIKNYTDRKIIYRRFLSFETKFYFFQTNGISFIRKGTLLFMWRRCLVCCSCPPNKSLHYLADFIRRSWTLKISIPTLRVSDLLYRRLWPLAAKVSHLSQGWSQGSYFLISISLIKINNRL